MAAVLVFIGLSMPDLALAGPPFRTDDPEPTDYEHWEIYVFSEETRTEGGKEGVLPGFEANYGLFPELEVSVQAPFAFQKETDSERQRGYGDTELAAQYRFVQEDENGWRPQVSFSPAWQLPTGDAEKDLGNGHSREFLPLGVQKSYGGWTTFGTGGYWINPGAESKDFWFFGWALTRKLTDQLEAGVEIFHETADTPEGLDSTGFNLGVTYDITENHHILFSAGRGFQHAAETNDFSYYAAYELTF